MHGLKMLCVLMTLWFNFALSSVRHANTNPPNHRYLPVFHLGYCPTEEAVAVAEPNARGG